MSTKRNGEALQYARDLYAQRPGWIVLFRELTLADGAIRKMFDNYEWGQFVKSAEYVEIYQLMKQLRDGSPGVPARDDDREPQRTVTVRMPRTLHESLKEEAHTKHTSMNQLCIDKLLVPADVDE